MNEAIFSLHGRLTRRDYALTIAALGGGASLLNFAAITLLLPLIYLTATLFFRETAVTFWILLGMGVALVLAATAILLPLAAIPATVRRLHDIGRSGALAFPLVLVALVALGLPLLFLLLLAALFEGMSHSPQLIFFDDPEELGLMLGGFVLVYFVLCGLAFLLLTFYAAWIFLKKGTPAANCYGAPPVEEAIPSVRAAYLTMRGRVDRAHFVFRALIALAAGALILPTLGEGVLYPLIIVLAGIDLMPTGADFFALLIGGTISPLATLPLVVQRLRTLGKSPWEALMVYAALLPNLLSAVALARFLGGLDALDETAVGSAIVEDFVTIGTADDTIFIVLWVLCGILSLIGVLRLLRADQGDPETR